MPLREDRTEVLLGLPSPGHFNGECGWGYPVTSDITVTLFFVNCGDKYGLSF